MSCPAESKPHAITHDVRISVASHIATHTRGTGTMSKWSSVGHQHKEDMTLVTDAGVGLSSLIILSVECV